MHNAMTFDQVDGIFQKYEFLTKMIEFTVMSLNHVYVCML